MTRSEWRTRDRATNHRRGQRIDDTLPDVVERPLRRPHPTTNPYISHRCTFPTRYGAACDCGDTFTTATELELHQSPYRQGVR